jgi:hypothetical protein
MGGEDRPVREERVAFAAPSGSDIDLPRAATLLVLGGAGHEGKEFNRQTTLTLHVDSC